MIARTILVTVVGVRNEKLNMGANSKTHDEVFVSIIQEYILKHNICIIVIDGFLTGFELALGTFGLPLYLRGAG
jgi:hypothetical protein